MSTCILWFRNNLRLSDNKPVWEAFANFDHVIPVYLKKVGPALDRWGNPYMGPARTAFLDESLISLSSLLEAHGSALNILEISAIEELIPFAKAQKANAIIGPQEMAYNEVQEELELTSKANQAGISVRFYRERTLFNLGQLPFELDQLPETFSRFRNKVEKKCTPQPPLPEPEITAHQAVANEYDFSIELNSKPVFKGGAQAAWDRLDHYFWETELVSTYKETRNGLLGLDYSSKFSPYLALGCISAREIYAELTRYEEENGANESTYWLYFELLWREYFQWIALKHGKELFLHGGLKPELPIKDHFNLKKYEAWKEGRTKDNFVNANMLELATTGFMSNRGRQNVASYLIHDMGLDWRSGAAYFESQLIDYDPSSNYGNWLYIAGRGNDPRPFRKFNTKMQAERYDPTGEYVSHWTE